MKWFGSRILWGSLLVIGGILYLLQSLGVFSGGDIFWGIFLGLIGVIFLANFLRNRVNWWMSIPGIILLVIGIGIILDVALPGVSSVIEGSLILGGIGLAFWLVYLTNRAYWWAIIPGGVMVTLAVVAGLEQEGIRTDGIFFLGLGITFALLGVLPNPHGQLRWGFIPAAILVILGLVTLTATINLINYLWPAVLILLGLYLVWRTIVGRRG